jgi:hypothetical protein
MRFLSRRRSSTVLASPVPPPGARQTADLSGHARVGIVGESHYQDELARIAGPKQPGGVHLETTAVLLPEPENPFDANAIAVHVLGGGKVGYLSREDAVDYGPLVRRNTRSDAVAACEAIILGADATRQTQYCVWLHIQPATP